ncbi:MAG: hypothetical protein U0487_01715 [Patescibacteria group bacterium]
MWRGIVGLLIAILLGWGFWRLGDIPALPPVLAGYAELGEGKDLLLWIAHPQANETRVLVNGALTTWLAGESSWLSWLRSPSRWLHERLSPAIGPGELHRIVSTLAKMRSLADQGKAGSASKAYLDEEYRWKERLEKDGPAYKDTLRQAVLLGYWMFTDIDDSNGAYRIKQQLEDWRLTLSRDETESLAVRLLSLDARVNESERALEQNRFEEADLAASVSAQGLDNVAHDMDGLRPHWTEETANAFGEVWSQLHAQTVQLKDRIADASRNLPDTVATDTASSTAIGVTTSTMDGATTTTATTSTSTTDTPVATSTMPTIRRISVIPSSTSLSFGQTISLRAFALDEDGNRNDVTPRCQFSAAPAGFGQIDKQLFSAFANAGSAVITASCQLEDQSYSGSVTVEVKF